MKLLRSILVLIETQGWIQKGETDDEMAEICVAVDYIVTVFRYPLEAKGINLEGIQDELHEIVEYARRYLSLGQEGYRKIWYKLHTCPNSSSWSNVLLVCQLLFSLPFVTSRVEQMFSLLKVMLKSRPTH